MKKLLSYLLIAAIMISLTLAGCAETETGSPSTSTPAGEELTELVRAELAEFLTALTYLMDDPSPEEPELQDVSWGLFVTNDEGYPVEPLGGLYESVLSTDPTGRECRPKGSSIDQFDVCEVT